MSEQKSAKATYASLRGIHRAVPIILAALSVFTFFCFIINDMGVFGNAFKSLFLGLFSGGAYAMPALIALHAVFYASDITEKRIVSRIIFSVITVISIASLVFAAEYWNGLPSFNAAEFYNSGKDGIGGGLIGGIIGYCLIKVFSKVGLIIIAAATFAIYISYFFAKGQKGVATFFYYILYGIVWICGTIEIGIKKLISKIKSSKADRATRSLQKSNDELSDDDFFVADTSLSELEIKELNIRETRDKNSIEKNPTLQSKVFPKSRLTPEEEEALRRREIIEEAFKNASAAAATESEPQREHRRAVSFDYGEAGTNTLHTVTAPDSEVSPTPAEPEVSPFSAPARDESADSVFTGDFDPFGLISSEELASKPSSRSLADETAHTRTLKENINEMTEADIERAKKLALFEKKRMEAKAFAGRSATPVENDGEFVGTQKNVDFREHVSENLHTVTEEIENVSFKIEKNAEAPKTEPASYTSIGYGHESDSVKTVINKNAFTEPQTLYSHTEPIYEGDDFNRSRASYSQPSYSSGSTYSEPADRGYAQPTPNGYAERPAAANYSQPVAPAYSEPADRGYAQPTPNGYAERPAAANYSQPVAPAYSEPADRGYAQPAPNGYAERPAAPNYSQPVAPAYSEPADRGYAQPTPNGYAERPAAPNYSQPVAPAYSEPADRGYAQPAPNGYAERPAAPTPDDRSTISFTEATPVVTASEITTANVTEDASCTKLENEPQGEARPTYSYTATENFGKDEEKSNAFVANFKPYAVPNADDASITADAEVEEESEDNTANVLTAERTIISDYDDESDADEGESDDNYTDSIDNPEEDSEFSEEEIPEDERNPVVDGYRDMFPALREKENNDAAAPGAVTYSEAPADDDTSYRLISPDDGIDNSCIEYTDRTVITDTPPFDTDEDEAAPAPEKEAPPKPKKKADFSKYQFPPIDFLGFDPDVADDSSEMNEVSKTLIGTLSDFGVTTTIKGYERGPRITRYMVVPAKGVRVNQVMALSNDVILHLARKGVRVEAPIPGKAAIGYEIPNRNPKNVRLRELIECEEFMYAKSKSFACIGKDVAGKPFFADIAKFPHALVAGATGMGKSVCINTILTSILYRARPDEIKLIMIDPKKVEFKSYCGIPHLLIPVITDPKQAAGALMWAVDEMERRFDLIEKARVRNLEGYNEKVEEDKSLGEKLPKIIIVIDEFADLMMQMKDPVEDLTVRLAQKARAAGIHLLIGTQRPDAKVITGLIKANIPTRMACKVSSSVDSRTIMEGAAAHELLDKGDMLVKTTDMTAPLRVQCAFVSDSEVENIMTFIASQGDGNTYDEEIFAEIKKAAQKCGKQKNTADDDESEESSEFAPYSDPQYLEAVHVAIQAKKISTSLLQRKLSIGYGKAAKYIDYMEKTGIVSEPNGQKPRDVLINEDDWAEKLARLGI